MFKLNFSQKGKSSLASIDKKTAQSVLDKLKWLVIHAEEIRHLPLEGRLKGLFKLKIGDWRVIYEIDYGKSFITVHKIGHRREIYKITCI